MLRKKRPRITENGARGMALAARVNQSGVELFAHDFEYSLIACIHHPQLINQEAVLITSTIHHLQGLIHVFLCLFLARIP